MLNNLTLKVTWVKFAMYFNFPIETLSMNKILITPKAYLVLLLFFLFSFSIGAQSVSDIDTQVLAFLKSNQDLICKFSETYKANSHEVVAFGYPKLTEFFEKEKSDSDKKLESLYIYLGSREADVQIGEFQLKTSFVEQIETIVNNHSAVFPDFTFVGQYNKVDERSIREQRITRMKDVEWQLNYLFAFKAIADSCFFGIEFKNIEEKTAFYSIAFDLGFKAKLQEIKSCYQSFNDVEKDKRVQECQKTALLATEFLTKYTPIFDCKGDFARFK